MFLVGTTLLPGCTPFLKRNGHVVKVDLSRNTALAKVMAAKAIAHLDNGNVAAAGPYLEKAIKADRRYAPAHNNMGLIRFEQNDLFKAALSFQEAMRFDPRSPEPQNNLGLTFETAGRPNVAIEHYQAAHDLAPTNPEYLGNLLRARLRSGEMPQDIREDLRQLLFIERRPEWIEWIDEQLELVTNPNLDRGPEAPDLDELTAENGSRDDFDASDRVIYDSGPEGMGIDNRSQPRMPSMQPPPGSNSTYPPVPGLPPQMPAAPVYPGPTGSVPLRSDLEPPSSDPWQQPIPR
jgi:hypothetical protein